MQFLKRWFFRLLCEKGLGNCTAEAPRTQSGGNEQACIAHGAPSALLPFGLAFAAGAMLYVVFHEMVPESHLRGYEREATLGAMVGFLLMALLDYLVS